jgi:hypothetical protein
MRLFGVAMVRNEADVIEAFVRHNLSLLDGLTIVDHGSVDATPSILRKLQDEGVPLRVRRDADPIYRQSEIMTALVREALSRERADFVFTLDADEFLKLKSRAVLEQALAEVPSDIHATMHWLTYVPDDFEVSGGSFGPGHLWWRRKSERQWLPKVIAGRALLERPDDVIGMGNHYVQNPAWAPDAQPHARLHPEVAALAHCPVRSRGQLEGKIIVGYLAHLATRPDDRRLARHWRDLYEELRGGAALTPDRLREIACNYGLPPKMWRPPSEIELIEDPVPLAFEQRYAADAAPGALQLLLRFTEALLAAERDRSRTAGATRYYAI